MRRISRLIGSTIIADVSGRKIGTVADVLVDLDRAQIVALVVRRGFLRHERVLPFADIATLGDTAIVARSSVGALDAGEWRSRGVGTTKATAFRGTPVITTEGNRIGDARDLFVDERTGALAEIEIQSPDFAGLLVRRSRLPIPTNLRIGRDAILIPPSAAESAEPRDI